MNKTIVALAILKALWEERHQSYLDNFNVLAFVNALICCRRMFSLTTGVKTISNHDFLLSQ